MSTERGPDSQRPPAPDWDANTLGSLLWPHRRNALLGLIAGLIVGLVYVLLTPNQYESTVEVAPAESDSDQSGKGGLAGQLGGLASLAGIDIPERQEDQTAVAVLRSNAFVSNFLRQAGALPTVEKDGRSIVARILGRTVGEQRAINRFRAKLMRVEEDRRAGTKKLTIRSSDREAAARWANGMIQQLNAQQRQRAIDESTKRLVYLDEQIRRATSVDVQHALYQIMEGELKSIAIAKTREDYTYLVIDPAVPALKKEPVSPNIPLVLFTSAISGCALAVLVSVSKRRK
jgi:uncharacterized protein involved in exopolysaccharide biosynthesis